jgi:hypothetical protein
MYGFMAGFLKQSGLSLLSQRKKSPGLKNLLVSPSDLMQINMPEIRF